jgi:protein-tyrosine-phosphatase
MAEALLSRQLAERGATAQVTSAGFLAAGWPATDPAISVMADFGLDISGHRSRTVTRELVEGSDLVIAMTRQQVVDLALLAPAASARLFQVRDLVRRARSGGRRPAEQKLAAWLRAVPGRGGGIGILSSALEDDIPDPVGQSRAIYERTGRLLSELCVDLAALIA